MIDIYNHQNIIDFLTKENEQLKNRNVKLELRSISQQSEIVSLKNKIEFLTKERNNSK